MHFLLMIFYQSLIQISFLHSRDFIQIPDLAHIILGTIFIDLGIFFIVLLCNLYLTLTPVLYKSKHSDRIYRKRSDS